METKERLTFDQLPDVVASLAQEISSLKQELSVLTDHCMALQAQPQPAEDGNQILTTAEACKVLKCSRHTLYRWVADGLIPCMKNGGKLTFFKDEIIRWHSASRKNKGETRAERQERYEAMARRSGLRYL